MLPTVLGAAGIRRPERLRGQSLLEPKLREQPIFAETRQLRTLIQGELSLVFESMQGRRALFDIVADPGQTRNLASASPGVMQGMFRELQRLDAEDRIGTEPVVIEATAEVLERLRALGYVR